MLATLQARTQLTSVAAQNGPEGGSPPTCYCCCATLPTIRCPQVLQGRNSTTTRSSSTATASCSCSRISRHVRQMERLLRLREGTTLSDYQYSKLCLYNHCCRS